MVVHSAEPAALNVHRFTRAYVCHQLVEEDRMVSLVIKWSIR